MQEKQPIYTTISHQRTHTTETPEKHKKHLSHTVKESTPRTIFIHQDHRTSHKGEYQSILFTRTTWQQEPLKIHIIPSKDTLHATTSREQKLIDDEVDYFSPDYHLKIGASSFKCIEANNRDERLSHYFENLKERDFCFVINSNNINHCYLPSRSWQKRFIAMITQGLKPLLSMDATTAIAISTDPKTKARRQEYQSTHLIPTCFQYAMFQNHGETKDPHMRRGTYKMPPIITAKATELGIFSKITVVVPDTESQTPNTYMKVHDFIHIGHGIGIGKLGQGAIFFHSIHAICKLYGDMYDSPIKLLTESCLSLAESELKASSIEHFETACSELSTNYDSSDSEYYDTDDQYHETLEDN